VPDRGDRLRARAGQGRSACGGLRRFLPKPVDIKTLLVAMERVAETPDAQPFGLN